MSIISKTYSGIKNEIFQISSAIFFIILISYLARKTFSQTTFDFQGIQGILTIFVIANSLFSIIIPITMDRKSMYGKRTRLLSSLLLLWISVILALAETTIGPPYQIPQVFGTIHNPLSKLAIVIWLFGIFYLLKITYQILNLDTIQFKKSDLEFQYSKPKNWGTPLDAVLKESERVYWPIIVRADENTRPWKILQNFIISGLTYTKNDNDKTVNPGGIYFTFTRPAKEILGDLIRIHTLLKEKKIVTNDPIWKNLVFIDCYTLKRERNDENKNLSNGVKLIYADSNNPHEMNKKYEEALRFLKSENCDNVRIVYDAISDFLTFTDFQLATQYLRHNMGYEQRKNLEALYLFRSGTMESVKEEYFMWFANGVLQMKRNNADPKDEHIEVDFRGPFDQPKKFKINYEYELL